MLEHALRELLALVRLIPDPAAAVRYQETVVGCLVGFLQFVNAHHG